MSPKPPACPVCRKPAHPDTRPFCGPACRDRDLLQWLGDGYRIAAPPAQEGDEAHEFGVDSTRE